MPGSPPTSPNFGAPRYAEGDTAMFGAQVNGVTDAFDAKAVQTTDPRLAEPGDLVFSAAATRAGCVLCDGSSYSQSTYAALFTALGGNASPFGVNGANGTFQVPDYRGRTIVGAGPATAGSIVRGNVYGATSARALGQKFGEETHALTAPEIQHDQILGFGLAQAPAYAAGSTAYALEIPGSGGFGPVTQTEGGVTTSTGWFPAPHNNVQPGGVANIFIKT